MGIDRSCYGLDLLGDKLYVEQPAKGGGTGFGGEEEPFEIAASKRINIDYAEEAKDFLWRFSIQGNPFVSVKV